LRWTLCDRGRHATDPSHHKLIGGVQDFDDGMYALVQLAAIAAVLIGASSGAGDLAPGGLSVLLGAAGAWRTITRPA